MATLSQYTKVLRDWTQKLGPYVLLEMLLPGGTIFALLLFLYRRRKDALTPVLP
jgi:hypothetical protein